MRDGERLLHDILLLGVDDVRRAKLLGEPLTSVRDLGDDDLLHTPGDQAENRGEPDRAAAPDQNGRPGRDVSGRHGVPRDGKRLHQGAQFERHAVGQGKDPVGRHRHRLAQPAAASAEADEAAGVAGVLGAAAAGGALAAVDRRLHRARLSDLESAFGLDGRTDLLDDARELVTQGDGNGVARDGMPGGGAEVGAADVLVKISSADADECRGDLG